MTVSLKQVNIVWVNIIENQGNHNQKHTIDTQNRKERNSTRIQKKTFKPQKEKQKEEMNKELQNQLENKVYSGSKYIPISNYFKC